MIMVRVQNDGIYGFNVRSEGEEWEPWSLSEHADLVQAAKAAWSAAHPLPGPWLSDVPPGLYELLDGPPRLQRVVAAEEVSGGRDEAAQQEDRPVEIASIDLEDLGGWEELAEAYGARIETAPAGDSGEHYSTLVWPDGRVAHERDRLVIISADSELPPVVWQDVFHRMSENHQAEVAHYRPAIEAALGDVRTLQRMLGGPAVTNLTRIEAVLAAALRDGE